MFFFLSLLALVLLLLPIAGATLGVWYGEKMIPPGQSCGLIIFGIAIDTVFYGSIGFVLGLVISFALAGSIWLWSVHRSSKQIAETEITDDWNPLFQIRR